MSERQRPSEYLISPEYWQGHHFEDDCEWHRYKELSKEEKRLRDLRNKEEKAGHKFAAEVLKDFFKLNDKTVIRRYATGQEFDGHSVQPGTVVRFYKEHLFDKPLEKDDPTSQYTASINYGVVYTAEHYPYEGSRRLAYLSEYYLRDGRTSPFGFLDREATIVMGEVDHWRHAKSDIGDMEDQFLDQVAWLEVMKLGKGMPEEKPVRSRLGKLIPIFSQ